MIHLKELRKELHLTQKELAALLQVNQTAVSQWERGVTMPGHQTLFRLCEILNVSLDYLMGRSHSTAVQINVYGTIPAGTPTEAIEDIIDTEEISAALLRGGKKYFGLKVKGDSMFPKYMEGDTIIIREQPACESGEDCVVYINGYEATLKRVMLLEDGGVQLQPLNPHYAPVSFSKEEVIDIPITIAGIVVEIRRKVEQPRTYNE